MESDFITNLYIKTNAKRIGTEEQFREAMQDTSFARALYNSLNEKEYGTFDEFLLAISQSQKGQLSIVDKGISAVDYLNFALFFLCVICIGIIIYFLWKSPFMRKIFHTWYNYIIGTVLIAISYELIIYSLCDYFFMSIDGDYSRFNYHLFRILNLIGLALMISFFAYKILFQKKSSS